MPPKKTLPSNAGQQQARAKKHAALQTVGNFAAHETALVAAAWDGLTPPQRQEKTRIILLDVVKALRYLLDKAGNGQ